MAKPFEESVVHFLEEGAIDVSGLYWIGNFICETEITGNHDKIAGAWARAHGHRPGFWKDEIIVHIERQKQETEAKTDAGTVGDVPIGIQRTWCQICGEIRRGRLDTGQVVRILDGILQSRALSVAQQQQTGIGEGH